MARPRMTHRPRDMILSLGVILVPILLVTWFFSRPASTPVQPVDVAPVLALARSEAPYPVLAPADLPSGWVARRATWVSKDKAWTNGWLTPGGVYVEVAQQPGEAPSLVSAATREGTADGTRDLAGVTWQRYRSTDGRTGALVRRGDGATTVVSGDLSYDDLAAFAGTLR